MTRICLLGNATFFENYPVEKINDNNFLSILHKHDDNVLIINSQVVPAVNKDKFQHLLHYLEGSNFDICYLHLKSNNHTIIDKIKNTDFDIVRLHKFHKPRAMYISRQGRLKLLTTPKLRNENLNIVGVSPSPFMDTNIQNNVETIPFSWYLLVVLGFLVVMIFIVKIK